MYSNILKDMKSHSLSEPPTDSEESESTGESEDGANDAGVVDYGTYAEVCTKYRKTCTALQEREVEVKELRKQNEAKSLTVKLLQDRLQCYGSIANEADDKVTASADKTVQLQHIIAEQKQVIQTLLGTNGKETNLEKVHTQWECDCRSSICTSSAGRSCEC